MNGWVIRRISAKRLVGDSKIDIRFVLRLQLRLRLRLRCLSARRKPWCKAFSLIHSHETIKKEWSLIFCFQFLLFACFLLTWNCHTAAILSFLFFNCCKETIGFCHAAIITTTIIIIIAINTDQIIRKNKAFRINILLLFFAATILYRREEY